MSGTALAGALALLATGCAGGPAPRDHYYRLEIGSPTASLPQPIWAGTAEVDRPRTDALTRERGILYRATSEAGEVQRYAYQNWVDSPTLLIQQELVAYLRAAGAAGQVVTPEMRIPAQVEISSRLLRLEHVRSGADSRVVVEIEFVVTERKSRKLLLHQTYREEREPGGGDVADAVAAFEAALHSIFARLLADAAG